MMFALPRRTRVAAAAMVAGLAACTGLYLVAGARGVSADPVDDSTDGLAPARLVGTWRLVEFKATTGTGQVVYPFGADAGGALTYTRDGHVWASVWKAGRHPFAVDDQQKGTPEEYTAAMQSYVQYDGRFTVDARAGTVSHHIEQSVFPNWNGTTQTRFYSLSRDGRRLSLTTPPTPFGGTTIVAALVWQRVR